MSSNTFIERQNTTRIVDDDRLVNATVKQRTLLKKVYTSQIFAGILTVLIFSILVPTLVFYYVIDRATNDTDNSFTCLVNQSYQVPCGPLNISEIDCKKIECCYDPGRNSCYHYLPSKYLYTAGNNRALMKKTTFGTKSIPKMYITVQEVNENRVKVILHDGSASVSSSKAIGDKNYFTEVSNDILAVNIYRMKNGIKTTEGILTTAKGPLIASEHYWEWTFQITDDKLLGLGELDPDLNVNSTLRKVIYKNRLDHSSTPMFIGNFNGSFSAVNVMHQGPLEVIVLPSKLVILRSLAGSKIELDVSVGPSLHELYKQITEGNSIPVPPRWILGAHVCREASYLDVEEAIKNYTVAQFPHVSDCFHQNLVPMLQDGTNLTQIIEILKNITSTKKLIVSMPPQIMVNSSIYNDTENLNVFFKYSKDLNGYYTGKYLTKDVTYIDYSSTNITTFTKNFMKSIFQDNGIVPDGLILDDNWPVDDTFLMDNDTSGFPYLPQNVVDSMSGTLPWNLTDSNDVQQIINHNDYGQTQVDLIREYYNTSQKKSILIMSASHDSSLQPYVIENVNSSWTSLRSAVKEALLSSMFGNNYISFPVCGSTQYFDAKAMNQLCLRWYLTAVTMPIMRISSQAPARFPYYGLYENETSSWIVDALNKRIELTPYFYTILQSGKPFLRPMFYDFYEEGVSFSLFDQYMIGEDLLVAQPLLPDKTKLKVYLPYSVGVWYEIWGGKNFTVTKGNEWIVVDVVENDWISFIAQGRIIPFVVQNKPSVTDINIKIAYNCTETCKASGSFSVSSEADSLNNALITMQANSTTLTVDVTETAKKALNCETQQCFINLVQLYENSETRNCKVLPNDICKKNGTFNISLNYNDCLLLN